MSRSPSPAYVLAIFFAGFYFLFLGRRRWQVLDRIRKTPTSEIGTAPIGKPAEIKTRVFSFPGDLTVSPLTQIKGAAYIWVIEEWKRTSRKFDWVEYSRFHSIPYLYFSDDGNELAGVDLEHVEFIENIFTTTVEVTNDLSSEAKALIKHNDLMIISEEFPRRYRIKEKVFQPGEEFFIHGLCTNPPIAYLHTISGKAQIGKRPSDSDSDGFLEKSYLSKVRVFFRGRVYVTRKSEQEAKTRLLVMSIFYLLLGTALIINGLFFVKSWLNK